MAANVDMESMERGTWNESQPPDSSALPRGSFDGILRTVSSGKPDWLHVPKLSTDRRVTDLAQKFMNSRMYTAFYFFMILMNLVLIVWVLLTLPTGGDYPDHWAFITLEVLINVLLGTEIVLKLAAQRSHYFRSKSNLFDVFVLVLCVMALLIYAFEGASISEEIDDAVSFILLLVRYILQFLRLLLMIKNQRQNFQRKRDEGIDFSTVPRKSRVSIDLDAFEMSESDDANSSMMYELDG